MDRAGGWALPAQAAHKPERDGCADVGDKGVDEDIRGPRLEGARTIGFASGRRCHSKREIVQPGTGEEAEEVECSSLGM